MKDSLRTGISFGLTSAVITTLGLMVGLHSGTVSSFYGKVELPGNGFPSWSLVTRGNFIIYNSLFLIVKESPL